MALRLPRFRNRLSNLTELATGWEFRVLDIKSADQNLEDEVLRRMGAGLVKALHTPPKPHEPSKAKAKESQVK